MKGTLLTNIMYHRMFFDNELANEIKPEFDNQLEYQGYMNAIVSTIQNFNLYDQRNCIHDLANKGNNIILIWGKKDKVIPHRKSNCFLKRMPDASLHIIKKAGHIPQYEKSEEVNLILIDLLK